MQTRENLGNNIVYTVGHSNIELENFINLLNLHQIKFLVDVRSTPYSKYIPQFNRKNIELSLENRGIEYCYLGDKIGGKPKDKKYYTNGNIQYDLIEKTEAFKDGISTIINIAAHKKIVLMCSEENPYKCHRHHLIAQNLLNHGLRVFHLRGDGSLEIARMEDVQLKLFSNIH